MTKVHLDKFMLNYRLPKRTAAFGAAESLGSSVADLGCLGISLESVVPNLESVGGVDSEDVDQELGSDKEEDSSAVLDVGIETATTKQLGSSPLYCT